MSSLPEGLEMVHIPAGCFNMGSEKGKEDEKPAHPVRVSSFYISRTPVTNPQYKALMGYVPSEESPSADNYPVENVSWREAVCLCNNLSKEIGLRPSYCLDTWEFDLNGYGFRLPTEAEWEYACRAGTHTEYYTGDSEEDLKKAGWYGSNAGAVCKVGLKAPNAFGLCDMHGNVFEWCNDWYAADYYAKCENALDPIGPETGETKVCRGGYWLTTPEACTTYYRANHSPRSSYPTTGFRVALGIPSENSGKKTDDKRAKIYLHREKLPVGKEDTVRSESGEVETETSELRRKSIELNDELQLELAEVPAGSFIMGLEELTEDIEKPIVDIDNFWISRTPVTNGQYAVYLNAALKENRLAVNEESVLCKEEPSQEKIICKLNDPDSHICFSKGSSWSRKATLIIQW